MPDFEWNKRWGQQAEQFKSGVEFFSKHKIYGYQWGDPRTNSASFVIPEFVEQYLTRGGVTLEIGPGGGRYSQFLTPSRKIIFVEYNAEFFPILGELLKDSGCDLEYVHSTNCTIPSVKPTSVDFVFSYDCFVHLEIAMIESYLQEIHRVLKRNGTAVIHYSDKRKKMAQDKGTDFSPTTPEIMRELVEKHGFVIKKEDTERIAHSAVIAFGFPA